jgi:hypothetical protein
MLMLSIKKVTWLLLFFLFARTGFGQEISQVSFSMGTTLSYISLLTDREVQIRISDDGTIMQWGIEVQSMRNGNYYAPALQPYLGRIEYYGPEADSLLRGKPRSIGSAIINYFPKTDNELKRGKIQSIGRLFFEYYDAFENKTLRGKIRSIGGTNLTYYSSFDDQLLVGKLKSIGGTTIQYYGSFDDKLIRGKIKSIGPMQYNWYTSLETQYGGGLKSGSFRQSIGGVTYILQ